MTQGADIDFFFLAGTVEGTWLMHKATESISASKPWGFGPVSSSDKNIYSFICVCVLIHMCVCAHTEARMKHSVSPFSLPTYPVEAGSHPERRDPVFSSRLKSAASAILLPLPLQNWGYTQLDTWILRSKPASHNCSSPFKPCAISVTPGTQFHEVTRVKLSTWNMTSWNHLRILVSLLWFQWGLVSPPPLGRLDPREGTGNWARQGYQPGVQPPDSEGGQRYHHHSNEAESQNRQSGSS